MTPPVTPTRTRHSDTRGNEVEMAATTSDLAAVLAQLAKVLVEQTPAPTATEPDARPTSDQVLLTVEEAARRLGIGRTFAWRLVRSGDMKSVQIGRLRRIHIDALRDYTDRLATKGAA